MTLCNSLFQLIKSLDNFQDVLEKEKENFESKSANLKEKIEICQGVIKTYQHNNTDKDDSSQITVNENLQQELKDVRQKLKREETKNEELERDVDELNSLIDLYVREAEKRDSLEEEYRDKATHSLKLRIKSLEGQLFCKIANINNLENVITELRGELSEKNKEIADLNEKLTSCKI